MRNNGQNTYGVSYSVISWLEGALRTHKNVSSITRHDDIIFEVTRKTQGDTLIIFCADEYVCGTTFVQHVLCEFPECNIISVGGGWNGYTSEAKAFCKRVRIGLFVSDELMGALFKDKYWNHVQRKPDGQTASYIRIA